METSVKAGPRRLAREYREHMSEPTPILAVADLFGISGRRQELRVALDAAERDAATHPGCVRYSFAATVADPDHFLLVSEWRDQAALDAHYASTGFANFQFSLEGVLARPSEMTVYSVSGSVRPLSSRPLDPRAAD
jgi:quinol monooxygenase YgiN